MRIRLYQILLIALSAAGFSACEQQADWPLDEFSGDYIVVDGNITNEVKVQEIRLLKPMIHPNDEPETVGGADVIVSTDENVYTFTEDPARPGVYQSEEVFGGKAGKTYSLLINHDNRIISAKATMVQATDFIFLRYLRQNNTKLFRIVWVANPYNAKRPAMYEILLDWSSVPGYENADPESTKARLLYYTLPTLDVSQIFAPTMETVLFPPGTLITEKRYSLAPAHAEFIRALLSETNWQGGLFNSAAANLPTNLSDHATGFFGACAVTTKTDVARVILPSPEIQK
ncbi:MAG: DUF4249 family protein [Lentimicrobium sp.]